jgi:A/G-specific adenine glycosylase
MITGLVYYKNFIKKFPTIQSLSSSSENKIYSTWKGLGYYNRAKNLLKTAKILTRKHKGKLPKNSKDLILLPGIGKYTAAAIASICYNEKIPVVDANVYRVLSRYFGIFYNTSKSNSYNHYYNISKSITKNVSKMGEYNQAIMDFGATICTPKKPLCKNCLLILDCEAYKTNSVEKLPIKKKRIKKTKRFFNYFIIENKNSYLVQKRKKKDVWLNLLEFFLVEDKSLKKAKMYFLKKLKLFELKAKLISKNNKAILSHQIINVNFFSIYIGDLFMFNKIKKHLKVQKIKKRRFKKSATPKVIDNYLNSAT